MLDDIGGFRGSQFQDFCNRLLSLEDGTFQAVDGSGGDLGNDGFCVRGETLYQAYAPERRTFAKVRSKVDDSVKKAIELRDSALPKLRRLVLLTPFDLTQQMHEHLRSTSEGANLVAESCGESRLHALVGKHPAIRSLFPEYLVADVVGELKGMRAREGGDTGSGTNEQALARASAESLRWPRVLPRGETLARPELDRLAGELREGGRKCFVLLGAPGAGKSALFAALGEGLAGTGLKVVALRCDRLPTSIQRREELASFLGLAAPLDRVLSSMAATGPTVLLIDQLDALCDIVDLQSERLTVILDLLDRARDIEGMGIVVACRAFDYRHDPRVGRLNAEAIRLELPAWSDVAAILAANGIAPDQFPSTMREVLRVPQHLKVFLSLTPRRDSLESYQGMLEQFWQERVTRDPAKVTLTNLLAEKMGDEEVLALPASVADGAPEALRQLEHDGVLRLDDTSRSVSFAHQTLFEFARARIFGAGRDLVAFVKERQDGVFVRPVLWSALAYLRAGHRALYAQTLAALWGDASLRLHLRYLLLEFVGQVGEPSDDETELILAAMRDRATCSTALAATAGNVAWFSRLFRAGVFTTDIAALAPQALATVLAMAVRADPGRVVDALRALRAAPLFPQFVLHVLQSVESWSPPLDALARELASQTPDRNLLMSLASRATRFAPELAIELVATGLRATLAASPPSPSNEGEMYPRHDKGVDAVLTIVQHFPELEELAKKAPVATREVLFPIWLSMSERLAAPVEDDLRTYRTERALDGVADAMHPSTFAVALRIALETSAAADPASFVAFASRHAMSDLNGVHAMLSFGFAALPSTHQRAAFEYVQGDPRRLRIRGFGDSDGRSLALLRALGGALTAAELAQLETSVATSQVSDERSATASAEARRARMHINRRHRLRLLRSLPQERLSTESKRLVREEDLVFPNADTPDVVIKGGIVGSPMSSAQMEKASDEAILNLFDELVDTTDEHPRRFLVGGSVEASRELGRLAKRSPERVLGILAALRPEDQQTPLTEALAALAEAGFEQFHQLLLEADARGFNSEEFRWQMAYAVGKRAQAGVAVPEEITRLLERWLDEAPPAAADREEAPDSTSSTREKEPILFGWMGGGVLPRGGFPFMQALLCVHLRKEPAAMDRWLEVLERRLPSAETTSAWSALCYDLPKLGWVSDRARVARFFAQLFEKHQSLLQSKRGAYLIASTLRLVDDETLQLWIGRQLASSNDVAQQAAGELLMVCALHRRSAWVDAEIERLANGDPRASLLIGVGFAVANTWGDQGTRRVAAKWLTKRLSSAQGKELRALFTAFGPRQELWGDDVAVDVLRSIEGNASALAGFPDEGLDQIELLVAHKGDFVVHFVNAMLDAMASAGIDVSARFQWSGGTLVDLTLALQRRSATRTSGMALFERLLSLGLSSVRDVLFEIDARPRFDPPGLRPPRRPRPRS